MTVKNRMMVAGAVFGGFVAVLAIFGADDTGGGLSARNVDAGGKYVTGVMEFPMDAKERSVAVKQVTDYCDGIEAVTKRPDMGCVIYYDKLLKLYATEKTRAAMGLTGKSW